ncbi:hypothetical protein DFH09DRAFT_1067845 [Mycena vulgaris]|nr:hypothetical protein DFH09DRAFT_1067845 [Mycena vulgaris]
MDGLWLGLEAVALARLGVALAPVTNNCWYPESVFPKVFFGQLLWENITYAGRNDEKWLKYFMCIFSVSLRCRARGSKATAFWPGFGLSEYKAGPKAISGQHFGLALALVPKPKSRGFLASGQSQSITTSDSNQYCDCHLALTELDLLSTGFNGQFKQLWLMYALLSIIETSEATSANAKGGYAEVLGFAGFKCWYSAGGLVL